MKHFLVSAAVSVVILGSGIAVVLGAFQVKMAQSKEVAKIDDVIPNVAVSVLHEGQADDLLILTGSVVAWESVTMSAETTGKIETLDVEEGMTVVAEGELIQINTTVVRAQMDQAHAEYRLAQQELSRVESLRKEGISSRRELDQARTREKATTASRRLAEIQLAHSVIRAQFSGLVDRLYKEEGEFVSVGTPLIRIIQVDKVKVLLGIPERDLPFISEGERVLVGVDAYPDRKFVGTIHRIAASADAATRTFITEVEIDNSDGVLRPGMMARARLVRTSYENAITVPLFAIMLGESGRFVYIEEDGIAKMRPVEIGFLQGEYVHITDGIEEGDRLIVVGQRQLKDGEAVRVRRVTE